MHKVISGIIIVLTVITAAAVILNTPFNPCGKPFTYKIGTIDPKFGLKEEDALADAGNAAAILGNSLGHNIFDYSGNGELTINFVYDVRSALESDITKQEGQINKENTNLQKQIASYEADVKVFEQKVAALNATIQSYNSQGGAPPDVYNNLVNQQNELKIEGDVLNARAKQLNLTTNNYNAQVNTLNQNVSQFNQAIAQKPEEGLYDGNTKTITIYFVDNKPELVHTLTHEFGHALGMNHVDDPKAIMYPYISKTIVMTAADKQQLDSACHKIPIYKYWLNRFRGNQTT